MTYSENINALFIDFDSYFASVEQHYQPELRGRPVGVAPVMTESSCCIAASYEAKLFGVKTGTRVSEARVLCPDIQIVAARPELYIRTNQAIVEVVEQAIHVEEVLSIDEMWAWLPYNWRTKLKIEAVAATIKQGMLERFSPALTCSIGVAPNRWLAKMASKMRKPNGYFMIRDQDLPHVLHEMELSDIHGVGSSMKLRLHASGIHTVEQLCAASRQELHTAWGSIQGDRLYLHLRGHDVPELASEKRTIGHSHILPPDKRRPAKAESVLHKLTQKAGTRLRSYNMLTGALVVHISYFNSQRWVQEVRFDHTSDGLFLAKTIAQLWRMRPAPNEPIQKLGVTLHRLLEKNNYTPSLFTPPQRNREQLNVAIDALQKKFGKNALHLGCDHDALDNDNMRIAFTHIPDLETENY